MAAAGVGRSLVKSVTREPGKLSQFVDSVRVNFRGGRGGDGCIAMLSLFANECAGPCGGNGGNGGHIVLRANSKVKSLKGIPSVCIGQAGERGLGKTQDGKCAEHTFIDVPIGTLVAEPKPKEFAQHEFDPDKSDLVADLDIDGSLFIAARGGAGGKGNAYYLSNSNRHPGIAQRGAQGEDRSYELRMRLYAHIGLIGLPNAGKSTLLRTMTQANVKIGEYAFTTLYPQVGVMEFEDYSQLAISDLPGLIEDSHKNRGLGLQFLRHVRRCACLLYVIDLSNDPVHQLRTLWHELDLYKTGLSRRPHLILANKIDLPESSENLVKLREFVAANRPETRIVEASSLRGDNLETLRLEMRRMRDEHQAKHVDDPAEALVW